MNPESRHISKLSLGLGITLLIIILALGGCGFYFYTQYRQSQAEINLLKNNPSEVTKIETQKLLAVVGKLIILPDNETPVDITVTDVEKLKGQALFANAQNGDHMLVYSLAKKAFLYRPSQKILVDVFNNIVMNNPTPPPSATTPAPETTGPISPLP